MGVLYIIGFRVMPYAVLLWLAISLFLRLRRLKATPVPLQIGLEPVAGSRWARVRGFALMLFGANPNLKTYPPALALGGLCLHLGILLALVGHLRLFLNPVPTWLFFLVPLARVGGCLLGLGLLLLLMRRLADPRLWLLSKRADYGVLALLLAVALSGLALVYWAPPDPVAVKAVTLGLLRPWSAPGPWPGWLLASHIALVMALLAVFPFSKLMHGPQVFLNPIIWQVTGLRAQSSLNPWDESYLGDAPSREAVLPGEPQPWTKKDYRERLKNYWSGAGTKEVLSATQRAAAKPRGGQA
jgi:nitrate reductase gamma subunit